MTQTDRAHAFKALHRPDSPLVLYNIWDAATAKTVAEAGAPALATGSWSVAEAQGYPDGQQIPLDFALRIIERIVQSVSLPVSADFEGGYAETPEDLAKTTAQLVATGIVGVNFEDQIVGTSDLYTPEQQALRIKGVRKGAGDIPLFINARTDIFLKSPDPTDAKVTEAIERGKTYAAAGADGFFVPGLSDAEMIRQICETVPLPLNITAKDKPLAELVKTGASRISFGPKPFADAMEQLRESYMTQGQSA